MTLQQMTHEEAVDLFGPFKTFQVKIAEIERVTGLTFHCGASDAKFLRDFDPLATLSRDRRRSRRRDVSPSEAALAAAGGGYYEIRELEDIVS